MSANCSWVNDWSCQSGGGASILLALVIPCRTFFTVSNNSSNAWGLRSVTSGRSQGWRQYFFTGIFPVAMMTGTAMQVSWTILSRATSFMRAEHRSFDMRAEFPCGVNTP